jgi:hypothetical protein
MPRITTCLWTVTPDLLRAVDTHLGPPVDSYVNGSQTWFTDEPALGDVTLEWRLHPVANFAPIAGVATEDRWEQVIAALDAADGDTEGLTFGDQVRTLDTLWDGLECFVAYDEDCEPANLARAAGERLGIAPTSQGLVDHDAIGDAWERANGGVSISALLREQLTVADD